MRTISKVLVSTFFTSAMAMTASVGPASAASAMLKVSDQKPSGETVTIADASLPADGFLVIHPSDASGNLVEKDIGHVALKPGDHKAVKVQLMGTHKAGEKLWAMLHEDTGVKGKYEFGEAGKSNVDMPMKDDGKVVEQAFKLE